MNKVFFDTSALIKRYIDEFGSDEVIEICQTADSLIISVICLPEMISTLNRLKREKVISEKDYRLTKKSILTELEHIEVVNISTTVVSKAIHSLERKQLRAMDSIHIACALAVQADLFVSADKRQLQAAQNENLTIKTV